MLRAPFLAFTARFLRRGAAALALLVAAHGVAAVALSARGSLHTHAGTAATTAPAVVLDDVRRGPAQHESAVAAAAQRHGHAHANGDDTALRHLHGAGDASVVLAAGEAASDDGDDAGGASVGAVIGLVPQAVASLPRGDRDAGAARRAWVPRTHHPDLFERPPRSA